MAQQGFGLLLEARGSVAPRLRRYSAASGLPAPAPSPRPVVRWGRCAAKGWRRANARCRPAARCARRGSTPPAPTTICRCPTGRRCTEKRLRTRANSCRRAGRDRRRTRRRLPGKPPVPRREPAVPGTRLVGRAHLGDEGAHLSRGIADDLRDILANGHIRRAFADGYVDGVARVAVRRSRRWIGWRGITRHGRFPPHDPWIRPSAASPTHRPCNHRQQEPQTGESGLSSPGCAAASNSSST